MPVRFSISVKIYSSLFSHLIRLDFLKKSIVTLHPPLFHQVTLLSPPQNYLANDQNKNITFIQKVKEYIIKPPKKRGTKNKLLDWSEDIEE